MLGGTLYRQNLTHFSQSRPCGLQKGFLCIHGLGDCVTMKIREKYCKYLTNFYWFVLPWKSVRPIPRFSVEAGGLFSSLADFYGRHRLEFLICLWCHIHAVIWLVQKEDAILPGQVTKSWILIGLESCKCYSETFKLGFLVCFPLFSLINCSSIFDI